MIAIRRRVYCIHVFFIDWGILFTTAFAGKKYNPNTLIFGMPDVNV